MKSTNHKYLAFASSFFLFSMMATASPLAAGGSTSSFTIYSGGANSYSGTFLEGNSAAVSNNLWSGVLRSGVFRSAAGTLDFLYQVSENAGSSVAITKFVNSSFEGFTTDVGIISYDFDGAGTSSVNFQSAQSNRSPLSISRSTDGSKVAFDFGSINAVDPNYSSWIMVVRTNAVQFTAGLGQIMDKRLYNTDPYGASYQPYASGVPEPATFVPIGVALIAFALIRRKSV